jgi:hypothetical protein
MATPTITPAKVVVPVVSAWYSKINWTQLVSGAAMALTFFSGGKAGLDTNQQLAVVTTIGLVTTGVTWALRTFFNGTVNPASLPSKSS